MKKKTNLTRVFVLLALALTTWSCNKEPLKNIKRQFTIETKPSFIEIEICDPPDQEETDAARIVFAIDKTGSTNQSDPGGAQRFTNLIQFINERMNDPNLNTDKERYALIEFNESQTLLNGGAPDPSGSTSPFLSIQDFLAVVQAAQGRPDQNGTPYIGTFSLIQQIFLQEADFLKRKVEEDPNNDDILTERFDGFVFFVTDGAPCSGIDGCNGTVVEKAIEDSVEDMIVNPKLDDVGRLIIRRIEANFAFFQTQGDAVAEARLKRYAEIADRLDGGSFISFVNGNQIDYKQFVNIRIRRIISETRNWFIENRNASFSKYELNYLLDTDMDGVPDEYEIPFESCDSSQDEKCLCMNNPDCDGDGIGDGVEALVNPYGVVCDDPDCKPTQDLDLCMNFEKTAFIDSDGDTLPDCWERELSIDSRRLDTNEDGIPDHIAFYNNYFLGQEGEESNGAEQDLDGDGITDMDEISRLGTPATIHNKFLHDLEPLVIEQVAIKEVEGVDNPCNVYHVKNLPILTKDKKDIIRITTLDQQKFGASRKSMRMAEKPLDGNGKVRFLESDFKLAEPVK
ncbi:MAG: VWA domain-containing protein [Halobacteriovoraceae bacterium]|nr:VWA domain-containing protein [Halobacteriovoraceae bacterium]MCB9095092.1 VWA domain-containing protein [Halobacteriovoraceae bacterium]